MLGFINLINGMIDIAFVGGYFYGAYLIYRGSSTSIIEALSWPLRAWELIRPLFDQGVEIDPVE